MNPGILFLLAGLAGDMDHTLKSDRPPTGSMLRQNVGWSSVPFDKSYEELTVAQKDVVHSRYESIGPGDEPPYPRKGTARIFRELRDAAGILQSEGELFLSVMVGPDGKGTQVSVYQTPHPDLATFGASVLMKERFKPALCKGQLCAQEFPLRLKFLPAQ